MVDTLLDIHDNTLEISKRKKLYSVEIKAGI